MADSIREPRAKKWECNNRQSTLCSRGNGTPTRKACQYCGSRIRVDVGLWGVFTWTGEGRYPLSRALATFTSHARAEKAAEKRGGNSVVRWIFG